MVAGHQSFQSLHLSLPKHLLDLLDKRSLLPILRKPIVTPGVLSRKKQSRVILGALHMWTLITHRELLAPSKKVKIHGQLLSRKNPMKTHGEPLHRKNPMTTHGEPLRRKMPLRTLGEPL